MASAVWPPAPLLPCSNSACTMPGRRLCPVSLSPSPLRTNKNKKQLDKKIFIIAWAREKKKKASRLRVTTTNGENNTTKHLACGPKNPSPSPPCLCPASRARRRRQRQRQRLGSISLPRSSAVAKAHHKNVNEVDRQRAKTRHSKATSENPPCHSQTPPLLYPKHNSTSPKYQKKRQPIERNICWK